MIEWNIVAFFGFICSLMSAAGAAMTLMAKRSGAHLLWGILSLVLAIWTFGLFLCFSATQAENALFWARALNYVAIFLPVLVFHFVVLFVGRLHSRRHSLRFYYLVSIVYCFAAVVWPESFLHSPSYRFNMFWFPLAGPLFYFFPIGFLVLFVDAVMMLLASKEGQDRSKRLQINYLLIAVVVGLSAGGSTLPLQFDVDLLPVGIIGVALMDVLFTYAILKHDLLDIPETVSALVARLMSYICVFAIAVFSVWYVLSIQNLVLPDLHLALVGGITVLVCEVYHYIKDRVQFFADSVLVNSKLERQREYQVFAQRLDGVVSIDAALQAFGQFLERLDFVHVHACYLDASLLTFRTVSNDVPHKSKAVFKLVDSGCALPKDLPDALELNECVDGLARDQVQKKQMVELMGSAQLDKAYSWVDSVPERELVALPLAINGSVQGVLLVVIGSPDFRFPDQSLLQSSADLLARTLEYLILHQHEVAQKQRFLMEKMTSLQALAGSVAHEMRTPLGQLDFLVSDMRGALALSHERKGVNSSELHALLNARLDQAQLSIDRSLQVIDITMGVVRNEQIDTGAFLPASVNKTLAKALNEYVYLPSERRCIDVAQVKDFIFLGDETLFVFVVFNLLKNALSYSYLPNFALRFSSDSSGERNVLVVQDTGPGIAPEIKERLFEDFVTANKAGGTGLGLSYCKRVMTAFGGDISCVSDSETFTEFRLSFPKVEER